MNNKKQILSLALSNELRALSNGLGSLTDSKGGSAMKKDPGDKLLECPSRAVSGQVCRSKNLCVLLEGQIPV